MWSFSCIINSCLKKTKTQLYSSDVQPGDVGKTMQGRKKILILTSAGSTDKLILPFYEHQASSDRLHNINNRLVFLLC